MEKHLMHPRYGILLLAALISGCLFDASTAKGKGTGEETTNGISGLVSDGQGPVAGVAVSLFSRNYHPLEKDRFWQTRHDTITDANGYYHFRDLEQGEYNVLAGHYAQGKSALIQGVNLLTDTGEVAAPIAQLRLTGTVSISLNEVNPTAGAYIYVPGTPLFTKISNANIDEGRVSFPGLPSGEYANVMYIDKPGATSYNLLGSKLIVLPGDSLSPGPYAAWAYATDVHINTSASGANIKNDLFGFPLLVKLTAENFSFANADFRGNDLRIVKMDNTPLPYEIESWDRSGQTAIIWVGIDTLKGNKTDQMLKLYYGNSRVTTRSSGPEVFNKKNGYTGVWHLNDNSPDFIVNESSAQANGIARNLKSEIETQNLSSLGVIGRGFSLANTQWIDLGRGRDYVNQQPAATLSGWCKPVFDSVEKSTFGLINIGVGQEDSSISTRAGIEISDGYSLTARGRALDFDSNSQSLKLGENLVSNTWYFFTAVLNYASDSIYVYVDGTLRGKKHADFSEGLTENTNSKFSAIGAQDNGDWNFFSGQLDEMRVKKGASSPDWIKMSYENQKPGSNIVTVRKTSTP
jgi:Domain of unknown function (DUF2341)/Concanavalin A-like lectin/glucanases superfamily/Carboxypeptidase regulatory-like domain